MKPARSLCDAFPAVFSCSDLDVESVVLDLTRDCLLFFFFFWPTEDDIARGDEFIGDISEAVYTIRIVVYTIACNI